VGGLLLLLMAVAAVATNSGTTGRAADTVAEWRSELERVLYKHIDVLESEDCVPRVICELGVQTKSYNFTGKEFIMSLAERFSPELMKNNMSVLKKASMGVYDKRQCRKLFKCEPPTRL